MALSLNYASAGSLLGFGCLPLTLGVKPHCGRISYSIRPKSPVMSMQSNTAHCYVEDIEAMVYLLLS